MSPFNIEEDNRDVKKMVHAAKYGNWGTMYEILYKKPYLVNCIPEHSAWGILHQAVYWNNLSAIENILAQKTCDSLIKTKRCRDELVPPGSSAIDIANKMKNREEIKRKIKSNIDSERANRFSQHIPYKVSRREGEKRLDDLPLFIREIAIYKDTLVGSKHVKNHLIDIMKQIFKNESHNWDKVEQQLHQSLYGFDKRAADQIREAYSEEKFFSELIYLYTGNWVYRKVNEAMAREFNPNYNPDAKDLALGLYALLFDITITFWPDLHQTSGFTYRGVGNKYGDYVKGQEIMFTSIISCSGSKDVAEGFAGSYGTLFIIDNSADATSRPKYIRKYSAVPWEDEYVYAIGTEFRITKIEMNGGRREIELKLLSSCKLCKNP